HTHVEHAHDRGRAPNTRKSATFAGDADRNNCDEAGQVGHANGKPHRRVSDQDKPTDRDDQGDGDDRVIVGELRPGDIEIVTASVGEQVPENARRGVDEVSRVEPQAPSPAKKASSSAWIVNEYRPIMDISESYGEGCEERADCYPDESQ